MMRSFNPLWLLFILFALLFIGGGRYYGGGTYQPVGFSLGGILLFVFVLYLCGVFR